MKKTKIVCTIGPASEGEETIRALAEAGMNVARLNTSHGNFEEHRRKILRIKKVREDMNIPLAILLDLAGPKMRTGYLEKDQITLKKGQELILTTEDVLGNEEKISINYKALPAEVKPGDEILLSDGAISLKVLETDGFREIKTRVENGGTITHKRGVNVPHVELKGISSITERDKQFIEFGVREGVDMFALSFVRKAEDVVLAKKLIKDLGGDQPVIAKIETFQALLNLEDIMVLETDGFREIKTRVENGGTITHKRGVNVPHVELKGISSITERDKQFIEFGVREGVDMFALSFVRKAEDVVLAKKLIKDLGGDQPVIAKIETFQALLNLEDIMEKADGVMVARGDLGVEIPLERVPMEQKRIISTANRLAKPVITATQMLESMVNSPRPTRAEVTDVANAILDGTDAIMLSEETAVGKYPVEAVVYMSKIAEEAEKVFENYKNYGFDWYRSFSFSFEVSDAISHACWQLSEDLGADTIITFTSTGSTARRVARFRPRSKIIASTPLKSVYHRLSLVWGVIPILVEQADSTDDMIKKAIAHAKKNNLVKNGEKVIITAGIPIGVPGTTNMLKVHEVH